MASLAGEQLEVAFQKFQETQNHIRELKEETTSCFHEIMREIPNMAMDNLLHQAERQEVDDVLNLKPCVIFMGQTNCGKSSVINEILQKSVLPANETPCTARMVRLTFSENPYYRIGDGKEVAMTDSIPRQVVQLGVDDRRDTNKIAKYVTCGIKNDLLKSGLDIIDSPGRNENEELNQLLKKEEERILILVYVVDGHNQLTIQDAEDLRMLYNPCSVFYVVSKVDPEDDSDSESDSESGDEKSTPLGVKQERMEAVYNRLVEEGLLDKHIRMEDCHRFHGLSAWKLHEARDFAMDSKHTMYLDDFENFKRCLVRHIEDIFEAKITNACNSLANAQKRCIDSLLSKARDSLTIENTFEAIEEIKLREQDFYRTAEQMLTDNTCMEMSLKTILSQYQEELVKDIGQITFERQHNIQEGAYITGEEAVRRCEDHVKDILITRLIDKYQKGLINEFQNEGSWMLELQENLRSLENTTECIIHALVLVRSLRQRLFDCYQIPLDLSECVRNLTFWGRLREGLWNFFRTITHPTDFILGRTRITVEWKQRIARKFLASIDTIKLASEVAKALKSRFDVAHNNFQRDITEHRDNVKRSFHLSKEQRSSIQKVAPKLASVELRTKSITDELKYGTPTFLRQIGKGGQGEVWEVTARDGVNYALKLVRIGDPGSEDLLGNLALEVHYTRSISHEHIMSILGSFIIQRDGKQHLAVLYELMASDVMRMLSKDPGDLKIRLEIGLQVAGALKYMHSAGLMHRDIKPENVLLDSEKKAKLADFGLCKPLAMSNQTICGTPLFLAPEILNSEGSYDPSVDVYSFGILLWFLCDGRGKDPQNVKWLALFGLPFFHRLGERPERRPNINDECWQLMKNCWDDDTKKRPNFDAIVSELKNIISHL